MKILSGYNKEETNSFEIIELFGKEYLFTDMRPYVENNYEETPIKIFTMMHGDEGFDPCSLYNYNIMVNYYGSIITRTNELIKLFKENERRIDIEIDEEKDKYDFYYSSKGYITKEELEEYFEKEIL